VQDAAIAHPDNKPAGVVTFSAGVAAAQPGETPEQVLLRADRALYQAKAHGRNQIAVEDLGWPSITTRREPSPHR
jgi:diguanylate cyclase (GGDEF)-like protein